MKAQQLAINFRPMKPREADTAKGVVSALYDQVGGVKEVMARLLIGKSQAYAFTDPVSPEEMSFARVLALTGPLAPAAAEAAAARAGGVFVPLPHAGSGSPMTLTAKSAKEHGEAIAMTLTALHAGNLSPSKKAALIKEIDEAICALAALRGTFLGEAGPA